MSKQHAPMPEAWIHSGLPQSYRVVRSEAAVREAVRIIAWRTQRNKAFGSYSIFADPAWDIILHIFVSSADGRSTSIKCASIAANVPASTAQRTVKTLLKLDLLNSHSDPDDSRRKFLSLTPKAKLLLERVLLSGAGDL